jgi:predicted deacylase
LKAFGAPIGVIFSAMSAFRSNVTALGGEFGGSGTVSVQALRMMEDGIINLLAHAGILRESGPKPPSPPTRLIYVGDRSYYVYVEDEGLFEPFVELGDVVEA